MRQPIDIPDFCMLGLSARRAARVTGTCTVVVKQHASEMDMPMRDAGGSRVSMRLMELREYLEGRVQAASFPYHDFQSSVSCGPTVHVLIRTPPAMPEEG